MTGTVGSQKFSAPEVANCWYNSSCDVWSFGVLIGEICTNPGVPSAYDDKTQSKEDIRLLEGLVGRSLAKKFTKHKLVSLANTAARVQEAGTGLFLVGVTQGCLELDATTRPTFSQIVNYFESCSRSSFDEIFVEHIQKRVAERLSGKVKHQVARRLRERYKQLKITSFDWSTEEVDDESTQMMANAAIDFAYVDLVLEKLLPAKSTIPVSAAKEKVSLKNVWEMKSTRLVAQGRAGAGKSTLLKWIAYQWSIGSLWQEFDVVIHVILRDLAQFVQFESLEEMVVTAWGWKMDTAMVTKLLESKAKILWLLDGWDEVQVSGVLATIRANTEPRVKWMIAGTRPEAATQFVGHAKLEVCGFSNEGRCLYISRYFSKNEHLAKILIEMLKTNTVLGNVCSLPLVLNLVCFSLPMLESGNVKNLKFSEIYDVAIDQLIERALHPVSTASKIHKQKKEIEKCLEWVGFKTQKQGSSVKITELENLTALKVGLIHENNGMAQWNHISFAEYFLAKYCYLNKVEFPKNKYLNLAGVFYCCLSKNGDTYTAFLKQQFLKIPTQETINMIHLCCVECEEPFWERMFSLMQNKHVPLVWRACLKTNNLDLFLLFFQKYPRYSVSKEGFGYACRSGHKPLIDLLVEKGANPNYGMLEATLNEDEAIIQYLVEKGANPSDGIEGAVKKGNEAMVRLLVEAGGDPNNGIVEATQQGNKSIIKFLVKKGADPNRGMEVAASQGNVSLLKFFIKNGAQPNLGIQGAVNHKLESVVRFLVENGANPEYGLSAAVKQGDEPLIKLLIEKGADPNKAMDTAARPGHEHIMELLISEGADLEKGMHGAIRRGAETVIRLLVSRGADPNKAMSFAAYTGNLSLVQFLVENGADPNNGMVGATHRHFEAIVQYLVQNGADPNISA
jgi:ankyrin repeat protein